MESVSISSRIVPGKTSAILCAAGMVLVLTVFPTMLPSYLLVLLSQGLIYSIAAMSLDLLVGYTGLSSLGHAAFFAIGAYATGILATKMNISFGSSLGVSIVFSAGAAAIVGFLALRAAGIYFLMITLAIAMCIWGLIYRLTSLTGGDNGISGIARPDLGIPFSMDSPLWFYYFILILFAFCFLFCFIFVRSPFGKTLIGIKDSESRMKVLGYNVWLHKYLVFVIACGFAGLAGNLYAYYNGFVSPNLSQLSQCIGFVLMVSLGGSGTLIGPIIGAFIITVLENVVSLYTERWVMILAATYVASALYAPEGILGLLRRLQKRKMTGEWEYGTRRDVGSRVP